MSHDATDLAQDNEALTQQLLGVSEHRSRLLELLTERAREIAELTFELTRIRTEGERNLEDARSAARQLGRANDKLTRLIEDKRKLELSQSQARDEVESLRWELSTTSETAIRASQELALAQTELVRLRQELDATRRALEAREMGWQQEREQLEMTVAGLSLEIRSEHQAARILERQWVQAAALHGASHAIDTRAEPRDPPHTDYRLARTEALDHEITQLREECAHLSATVRDLERDAGAAQTLGRTQQELRGIQVDKQLLERRLEDALARDRERESLKQQILDLSQKAHEAEGLKAEVERLRAKLYKAPVTSGTFPVATRIDALDQGNGPSHDLGGRLAEFALHADAYSAVVADDLGFTVASVGTNNDCDGLAAVAGEAERLGSQATQTLELSEITHLTLEDRLGKIAHFRYFNVEDNVMSIGTLGGRIPDQEELDQMIGWTRHALTVVRTGEASPVNGERGSRGRISLRQPLAESSSDHREGRPNTGSK